jgi:hypothetical protein
VWQDAAVGEVEIPLTGGTLTSVVRVGDTVRRPVKPWTPAVHAVLRHVRERGFDLAPEPLGFDDAGREMVTYIPGATVGWSLPWPDWIRHEELLEEVGAAMRRYHQAIADFRPAQPVRWQTGLAALRPSELVCHHDLAPYNVVVADRRLQGIIDWDLAGPGTAVSDLAFVAWQWVPLHGPLVTRFLGWAPPPDRIQRLRLLLEAYGLDDRSGFIDAVAARVAYNRDVMIGKAAAGDEAYQRLVEQGHIGGMDEALAFLTEHGPRLQDQL